MTDLKDKRVLLTGGSRGLGPVIAGALARRGAHLALAARSEAALQEVAATLRPSGVEVHVLPTDLADAGQREALVAATLKAFGRIDVLVHNAGLEFEGAYADVPWHDLRQLLEVNLVAPLHVTHLVLPAMLRRNAGHIVNIASTGAKSGAPYDATYCGGKAGLAEWARALRLEVEGTGVHVSTLYPGYVTDVGMFARYGLRAPRTIGSCTPDQVARAVVRAIERDEREVIVNSMPIRPALALAELFPDLGHWLMHRLGLVAFQRKKAEHVRKDRP
jgi:short-subunit dehydrogenase